MLVPRIQIDSCWNGFFESWSLDWLRKLDSLKHVTLIDWLNSGTSESIDFKWKRESWTIRPTSRNGRWNYDWIDWRRSTPGHDSDSLAETGCLGQGVGLIVVNDSVPNFEPIDQLKSTLELAILIGYQYRCPGDSDWLRYRPEPMIRPPQKLTLAPTILTINDVDCKSADTCDSDWLIESERGKAYRIL